MPFKGSSSGRLFGGSGGFFGQPQARGSRYEFGQEVAPEVKPNQYDRSNQGKLPGAERTKRQKRS